MSSLIEIKNCEVVDLVKTYTKKISWKMQDNEAWLVIGSNGSGKSQFLQALAGEKKFLLTNDSSYNSVYDSAEIVSLERAARLIQEERDLDETEYMDRIDEGRTGRRFICEVLGGPDSKHRNDPLPKIAQRLETLPEVKLCGVEKILDRGLKFMSTGEIRRMLLTRSLLSKTKLLILSDPFAGLDVLSRKILLEFFQNIVARQVKDEDDLIPARIILSMERYTEIPETITHVLEFSNGDISFCGTKSDYEKILSQREKDGLAEKESEKKELISLYEEIQKEIVPEYKANNISLDFEVMESEPLVKMTDVNVGWGDTKVLKNLTWSVKKGQHTLIRGPNGSGKTTLLELITGDNMQVFSNDVRLFGHKRGTGETIWDIKARLGIVSYRLHVEYRMLGSTDLQGVIISGFRDSIGLYENKTDVEIAIANRWLKLAGFEGREKEMFGSLSYGEQRAILIIRAAVKHPKLLILDEPCHGLDENFREKILNLLETISKTGTTTFLHVTHDASEVLSCEKNVLELHPGEDPMYKIIEL